MMLRRLSSLVVVLCAGIGLLAGKAYAIAWFSNAPNGNGQTPLPHFWPAPQNYSAAVIVTSVDRIGDVAIGRDDTSPFASVEVTFTNNYSYGTVSFGAGVPVTFAYRPNLDYIVLQLWNPAPGGPIRGDLLEHLAACNIFAKSAMVARSHMGTVNKTASVMQFWIDPTVVTPPSASPATGTPPGGGAIVHHLEFYKFEVVM